MENGINWQEFEGTEANGDFLKFADKETHVIGIREIRRMEGKFQRKQADGSMKEVMVPQVGLVIDSLDGVPPKTPMVFATSAKYLIATIRKYHDSGMLYKWYFEMQRNGMDKLTKYTIIPVKERPPAVQVQKPNQKDDITAFL